MGEFSYICSLKILSSLENTGNEIITGVAELLQNKALPIVIIPHSNPDGDAIGSAYGLAIVLKNAGHMVKIISPTIIPEFLSWLNGEVIILNYQRRKKTAENYIQQCGIMFCVDFNEAKRADEMEKIILSFPGTRIMVDHHPLSNRFLSLHNF
jgi:bifunctional oligoribonuclease and PAP phosphatase NrnA